METSSFEPELGEQSAGSAGISTADTVAPLSESVVRNATEASGDEMVGSILNGHKQSEEEDTANEDNLSPPPDTMSPVSSVPANTLEDEIVVGTHANAEKSSPLRIASDQEDEEMADTEEGAGPAPSHYPKRKRASIYNDPSEDKVESVEAETPPAPREKVPPKRHGLGNTNHVPLGYWRESNVPDEHDKHAVVGFIDVRDRLRTRIQTTNRSGEDVSRRWPLPPGPGGSWVTFSGVVFDEHLVNLDQHQVKEYVRLLAGGSTLEKAEAVKQAIDNMARNPPPDTAAAPPIAYGPEIPEHAQGLLRPEAKKRRMGSGIGTIGTAGSLATNGNRTPSGNSAAASHHQLMFGYDNIPGTRPTKILLGHWSGSSEADPANRHAVYGILGANDMFRVKVVRETRDGRFVDGNFPTGAGALWIHYEEVTFDEHLQPLNRPEIKEYCRVRQYQIDQGETDAEREENQIKAVSEARGRVFLQVKSGVMPTLVTNGDALRDDATDTPTKSEYPAHELRHSRREVARIPRHSLPDVEMRAANRSQGVEAMERTNSIARRELVRIETNQMRADQRAASREASQSNQNEFQDHMQRLNKVWASQENNRLKTGSEDAKIYMGVKYERKQNGPFQGKLVSQGTIISIDGEDYVEYRVLTKPSFF